MSAGRDDGHAVPTLRLVFEFPIEGSLGFGVEWRHAPSWSVRKRAWRDAVDRIGEDVLEAMLEPARRELAA